MKKSGKSKQKVIIQKRGKIDRVEGMNLVLFSIFYWIIYGIIYGCVIFYAPSEVVLFEYLHWNIHQTLLGLGIAIWSMISLFMGLKYRGD